MLLPLKQKIDQSSSADTSQSVFFLASSSDLPLTDDCEEAVAGVCAVMSCRIESKAPGVTIALFSYLNRAMFSLR